MYSNTQKQEVLDHPLLGIRMTVTICKSIGCTNAAEHPEDFCLPCLNKDTEHSLSSKYPTHFRQLGDATEIDIFAVNRLFNVQDSSGCMQHAISLLLLANTSSNYYADIRKARDALTRWLQLNQDTQD